MKNRRVASGICVQECPSMCERYEGEGVYRQLHHGDVTRLVKGSAVKVDRGMPGI